MSPAQALHAALAGESTITTLVAKRIYPGRLPPTAAFPALVFQSIDETEAGSFDPGTKLLSARVQVDSYARQFDDAVALDQAVRVFLANLVSEELKVDFLSSRHLVEDEQQLQRIATDFLVWA